MQLTQTVDADPKLTQVFYWLCPFFGPEQTKVITMEILGKVKRLYSRDKKSLHKLAKTTGLWRW